MIEIRMSLGDKGYTSRDKKNYELEDMGVYAI